MKERPYYWDQVETSDIIIDTDEEGIDWKEEYKRLLEKYDKLQWKLAVLYDSIGH